MPITYTIISNFTEIGTCEGLPDPRWWLWRALSSKVPLKGISITLPKGKELRNGNLRTSVRQLFCYDLLWVSRLVNFWMTRWVMSSLKRRSRRK